MGIESFSRKTSIQQASMAALIVAVCLLALASRYTGIASWLETVSFITGAVCVWLTVKEKVWNFPISLINAVSYCIVFYEARLFADAGLQVVYFALSLLGWYMWLRGGTHKSALRISVASRHELVVIAVFVALGTLGLWKTLHLYGGSASFLDALTTSLSLGAQWLLNRKKIQSWILWILVDIIYVPLYVYKNLYLTALLYAVFLVMAYAGLQHWRKSLAHEATT